MHLHGGASREDRMSSSMNSRILLVFVTVLALPVLSFAQKDTGSIVGTVKDPSGALVTNAKVTVTDVERDTQFVTHTTESGEFVASPLKIGRYTVAIEHSGFKRAVSVPVDLDVQQRIALNFTLNVGQATESVEVTGAAPLLETETSELGQVVSGQRAETLPLNGRNYAQLALLGVGVSPAEPGSRVSSSYGFSANGARSLQNNFLLDGVDNNATLGGPIIKNRTFFFGDYEGLRIRQASPALAIIPTPAMIAGDFSSFLDLTSPVNAVDAGGNPTNKPALDCNGNPTYVGEIFNTRLTALSNKNSNGLCGVPIGTDASGNPTNIFTGNAGLNTPIDPLAARLSALFPTPNADIAGNNFLSDPIRRASRNNFDIRIDHRISDKDDSFGRFSYEDQPSFIPPPFKNVLDGGGFFDGIEDNSYRSLALSETHLFRPTLVNEFRVGYNRINSHRFQINYNKNVSQQLGFPGVPFTPINGGLPNIGFSDGTVAIGSSTFLPSVEKQN